MKGARQRSRLVLGVVIVSLGVMAGCNAGKSLTAQVQSYMQNQQVAPQQAGGGHEEQVGEESCLPCDVANLPLVDVSADPSAWERIWAACPASPVAGYNYSVF